MRNRFLAMDSLSASSTSDALKDFQVFSFPAPNLSSPTPFLAAEIPLLAPDTSVHDEIDRFSFDGALADFLSDVIPRFVGADERQSSHGSTGMQFASSCEYGRKEMGYVPCEMEFIEKADSIFYNELEVEKSLKINSGASFARLPETCLHFEIAEMEDILLWDLRTPCEENEATLFFEVPGVSVSLDYMDVKMGISIISSYEADPLLSLVEDVSDILITDLEGFSAQASNSLQDNKIGCASELLAFELGESVLEIHENLSMGKTFNDILTHLKPQSNGDDLVISVNDFPESSNYNISEHFLTQDVFEYSLEHRPPDINSLLEMNLINLNGKILLEKQSKMYPVVSDDTSMNLPCSAQLEEVQVFDRTVNVPDMFSSFETADKEGFFEQMSKEEIEHMENFYELILTSELSLMDDQFKLWPAPVICDDKVLKSQSMIMEDIFNALKPHSFSVCDEIYLDWHPLLEGACNNETCLTLMSIIQEISSYRIENSDLNSQYEPFMPCDFDFMDDSSGEISMSQFNESANVHENCPDDIVPEVATVVTEIVNHEIEMSTDAKKAPKENSVKISSVIESISQSNDLNFFVGIRKGNAKVPSSFETSNADRPSCTITSGDMLQHSSEVLNISESNIEKIEVHKVSLSGCTLRLIDEIQGVYFSNLNRCKHLINNKSLSSTTELLCIPKGRLLELISEIVKSQYTLGFRDEAFVALLSIYAVKQLVYYLCYFGFHISYLYVNICTSKVDNLAERLQPLQSVLQDMHWKVENQIVESHPSLSLIEGLLKSSASNGCKKILIISNKVFWPSLKHKLTMLKISFQEVKPTCCPIEQFDILNANRSSISITEALSQSDCLLLSYEDISSAFPFNMFSNILEYGGPRATSRISEIFPCLDGLPCVHFIRLDMEDQYFAKALCDGFGASKNSMIPPEGLPRYMVYLQGCLIDQNAEGLLAQFPLNKSCSNSLNSASTMQASQANEGPKGMLHPSSSNNITAAKACTGPEVVIIVNTQCQDKNTIISRRSSYQKILELEKRGVQVVERDINLPLDLIFSAAVCLVWYEARSFLDKAEAVVNMSAVPAFIENIATKILMSLSFSFSGCILIFEGENKFLASVMESSDMLYAAAASLELNLQLFCSHAPETTDGIILNCIRATAASKDRAVFPSMSESECLAESFLTRFPSVNPLSAHAVLSSGGLLVEFLEWSHERRIQALRNYKLPAESVPLFNALCRYGELGESRSVMTTDCSSVDSDSSGPAPPKPPQRKFHALFFGDESKRSGSKIEHGIHSFLSSIRSSSTNQSHQQQFSRGLKRKTTAYQRKSPSIIDSFRYQGGDDGNKKRGKGGAAVSKQRKSSTARQSPGILYGHSKHSALIVPTWTPIDKRARQHLSFVRTGKEQQSRLVWRRSDSPRVGCSLRKRKRDGD